MADGRKAHPVQPILASPLFSSTCPDEPSFFSFFGPSHPEFVTWCEPATSNTARLPSMPRTWQMAGYGSLFSSTCPDEPAFCISTALPQHQLRDPEEPPKARPFPAWTAWPTLSAFSVSHGLQHRGYNVSPWSPCERFASPGRHGDAAARPADPPPNSSPLFRVYPFGTSPPRFHSTR